MANGSPTQRAGASHEDSAVELLEQRGLRIVARNFNSKLGEIDIVALQQAQPSIRRQKKTCLHFVEVRYRASDRFGGAAESVTMSKQAKLRRTAALFLQLHPSFSNYRAQFDVITISGTNYPLNTEWIQDAF